MHWCSRNNKFAFFCSHSSTLTLIGHEGEPFVPLIDSSCILGFSTIFALVSFSSSRIQKSPLKCTITCVNQLCGVPLSKRIHYRSRAVNFFICISLSIPSSLYALPRTTAKTDVTDPFFRHESDKKEAEKIICSIYGGYVNLWSFFMSS